MRPPSPARFVTVGLITALAAGLLSGAVTGGHEEGRRGIPIPYPEAGTDDLALAPRTWQVVDAPHESFIDIEGAADDPPNGTLAFRLLTELAALEAVLTTRGRHHGTEPLANIGVRWHAVTFDPPIRFDQDRTLSRVIPGALNWSTVEASPPVPTEDPTKFMFWSSIPIPTNGTVAPDPETSEAGHVPDPDAVAWLVWWVSFADEPRHDPDVGLRSPALARFGAGVLIDQRAAQSRIFDSQATISWHHDFVTVATGVSAKTQGQVNATGLYVQRTTSYTVARALDTAHLWGNNTTSIGSEASAVTTFDVPSYGRLPTIEPTSLFSPITLNVTVPLRPVPGNTTTWRLGDGPTVANEGHGVLMRGELGFLADAPLTALPQGDGEDEEPNGEARVTPGSALAWVLALLVASVAALRARGTR